MHNWIIIKLTKSLKSKLITIFYKLNQTPCMLEPFLASACLWIVYGLFMGCLWIVCGVLMGCLWGVYGVLMAGCLWGGLWDGFTALPTPPPINSLVRWTPKILDTTWQKDPCKRAAHMRLPNKAQIGPMWRPRRPIRWHGTMGIRQKVKLFDLHFVWAEFRFLHSIAL